jgi:hypothetical protein
MAGGAGLSRPTWPTWPENWVPKFNLVTRKKLWWAVPTLHFQAGTEARPTGIIVIRVESYYYFHGLRKLK